MYVYHYTSSAKALKHILKDGTLRFGPYPVRLNSVGSIGMTQINPSMLILGRPLRP